MAFFMMPLCVGAQNAKYFKYQGEINTSYSFCIDEELNNLNLEVINGVRFSRYLYAGVVLGATADFSDEAILFPIFIDVKGYMPVTSKMEEAWAKMKSNASSSGRNEYGFLKSATIIQYTIKGRFMSR